MSYRATGGSPEDVKNMGFDAKEILAPVHSLLIVDKDFEFTDKAAFLAEANYITAINATKADRMHVLRVSYSVEATTEDDTRETGNTGQIEFVREGKPAYSYAFNANSISPREHAAVRTLNDVADLAYFTVHTDGNVRGYQPTGAETIKPIPISSFRVKSRDLNTDALSRTTIDIVELDAKYANDLVVIDKPTDFDATTLESVIDVYFSVTSSTTSGFTLTAKTWFGNVSVLDILVTDIEVLNASLAVQTIDTLTDNEDGTYAAAGTLATGEFTVALKDAKDATTKGRETRETASFTVA